MRDIPLKVWRAPDWASGKYYYEFKDSKQNTFGGAGLSFDELIICLQTHFEEIQSSNLNHEDGGEGMSIGYCPFCGMPVMCCDREEHGGPQPCCPKCGIVFIKEVRYKFVWFQKDEEIEK